MAETKPKLKNREEELNAEIYAESKNATKNVDLVLLYDSQLPCIIITMDIIAMTVVQLLCTTSSTFSSYCIITLSFSHNV